MTSQTHVALDFASLVSFASECGAAAATGQDGLFDTACQVMYYGAANPKSEPSVFKAIYLAYAQAQNASAFGRKIDVDNDKAVASSASRLASFAKVGALGHFELPDMVATAVDARGGKSGSMYSLMVKVNGAQVKAGKKLLTEEEINACLDPADKADKSVADFLVGEFKRFAKFNEDTLAGIDSERFAALTATFTAVATAWLENPEVSVLIGGEAVSDNDTPHTETVSDKSLPDVEPEMSTEELVQKLSSVYRVTEGQVAAH